MRQIPPRESELAFIALWASAIIFALQGIACFLAGLFVLLKYRLIARWLLTGIALCFVVLSGVLFFEGKFFQGKMAPYNILLNCFTAVIYLGFGALFFRLGRRQGRQEDIERKEAGRKL